MKLISVKTCITLSAMLFAYTPKARAELYSGFDSGAEGWTGSVSEVSISWQDTGGTTDGYIAAESSTSGNWYIQSPASWSGDWSDYRVLKWDMIIDSGGYADNETGDLLIIRGATTNLIWNGPSPIWEWEHYEVTLNADAFNVDEPTFQSVITNVSGISILGQLQGSLTETIGIDAVNVTTNQPQEQITLQSTFDTDTEDWRPYDDVTLTWMETGGNPGGYLHGDDWADGRTYRFTTPESWAGDWSQFKTLSFDLKIISGGYGATSPLLWIRGANGQTLIWDDVDPGFDWTHYLLYLTPESFNVSQAEFDSVMTHVTAMYILGEYVNGDEQQGLDNVILSSALPPVQSSDLISTFDSDLEDWRGINDIIPSWSNKGNPGGCYYGTDKGDGSAWYFRSPESWSGNWSNFEFMQFQMKSFSGTWSFANLNMVRIKGYNSMELVWTGHKPHRSWTQYHIPLTPESFNVSTQFFENVISYVESIHIYGEVAGGTSDQCGLDNFGLYINTPDLTPPDHITTFDSDSEGWWSADGEAIMTWKSTGGNPGGYLEGKDDGGSLWYFASPETWIGDWRAYNHLKFDHKIVTGSNAGWSDPSFTIKGANNQVLSVKLQESSSSWTLFEADLSPATFGVSEEVYEAVMQNVVLLSIRGEYVSGSDYEGLDNAILSKSGIAQPVFVDPGSQSSTGLVLRFTTQLDATYTLESCTNLSNPVWEEVSGMSLAGDGSKQEFSLNISTNEAASRFYRLRAE